MDAHGDAAQRAERAFERAFGGAPTHRVRAPGRVNLIGEHTDYNDGWVLPCAIDFDCVVVARARDDRRVRAVAADFGDARDEFALDAVPARGEGTHWHHYLRGVVRQALLEGMPLGGADLAIAGDVPRGAGLSSSAALEVALLQAFKALGALDDEALAPTQLARIAQRAENDFVGTRCGIMDQLVSARAVAGHALLIDCRSLEARAVPLPGELALLIAHSNVRRGLVDSEYNARRAQCEAAARHFGVPALRDLTLERLQEEGGSLDPLIYRRARHVVTENRRTLEFAQALSAQDLRAIRQLMQQSHASMRDDFEITVPAIDRLAGVLQDAIGPHGGARMTGGGFGGCVVALAHREVLPAAVQAVAEHYRAPDGSRSTVWLPQAAGGAGSWS